MYIGTEALSSILHKVYWLFLFLYISKKSSKPYVSRLCIMYNNKQNQLMEFNTRTGLIRKRAVSHMYLDFVLCTKKNWYCILFNQYISTTLKQKISGSVSSRLLSSLSEILTEYWVFYVKIITYSCFTIWPNCTYNLHMS